MSIRTSFTNAGDTGLTAVRNYVCFDVAELPYCTQDQSSNDVRAVVHSILSALYDDIDAQDETEKMSNFTLTEYQDFKSEVLVDVTHGVTTRKAIAPVYTYPTE